MKKRSVLIVTIISFLLAVSVGYALFSQTVQIQGTTTAMGSFDIEFTQATVTSQVGSTNATAVINDDRDEVEITVPKLEYPGAYAVITVVVTNQGTIPAKLTSFTTNGLTTDNNIKISYNGISEVQNVALLSDGTQTFTITVMWDSNSTEKSENVEFTIGLNYLQATS